MIIETKRLQLIPLNHKQLKLWTEDISSLEKEINCQYCGESMDGFFGDIVKGQIDVVEKDEDNYFYTSFWFIIRNEDRIAVGSASFKGLPNENGEVEIGYGLGKEFENKGYMTEAVEAMCNWALKQKNVSHVIAETETGNDKSQNVLKRCGFTLYKEDKNLWWRL